MASDRSREAARAYSAIIFARTKLERAHELLSDHNDASPIRALVADAAQKCTLAIAETRVHMDRTRRHETKGE